MRLLFGLTVVLGLVAGRQDGLDARNRAFLEAVRELETSPVLVFLPDSGELIHVRTRYEANGASRTARAFPAASIRDAANEGYWADLFSLHFEGTEVGSLTHQLMHRPRWRRAPGNRFVPSDAPDSSAIYVAWRREGRRWVVSEIGDEHYTEGAPLPAWCC